MQSLHRPKTETNTGLTDWLTSANPAERQYAAESLAEMGDIHGTDFLILLASTEDRKRHKKFRLLSLLLGIIGVVAISLGILPGFHYLISSYLFALAFFYDKRMKASLLQQTAVDKLAEGRNATAIGTLADALWRPNPSLGYSAVQGLTRLLPIADKDISLSTTQWNLLLHQIHPAGRFDRRQPNKDLVIAILKAIVAAEYFPAIGSVYRLSLAPIGPWGDPEIRSAASDCHAHLIMRQQQLHLSSLVDQR